MRLSKRDCGQGKGRGKEGAEGFIYAITSKGREVLKEGADRKRLRKEVRMEFRVKVRAHKKSRTCVWLGKS